MGRSRTRQGWCSPPFSKMSSLGRCIPLQCITTSEMDFVNYHRRSSDVALPFPQKLILSIISVAYRYGVGPLVDIVAPEKRLVSSLFEFWGLDGDIDPFLSPTCSYYRTYLKLRGPTGYMVFQCSQLELIFLETSGICSR